MIKQDILRFAWGSFFLGLFISSLLTIVTGGTALLDKDKSTSTYTTISDSFSTQSEMATMSGFLSNIINSAENPLAFDIVLGLINVALFIFKIMDFLILILINYFTLSIWLLQAGTPAVIVSLLIMSWQFWTFYVLAKFIFKDRVNSA